MLVDQKQDKTRQNQNIPYDKLEVGQYVQFSKTLSLHDIELLNAFLKIPYEPNTNTAQDFMDLEKKPLPSHITIPFTWVEMFVASIVQTRFPGIGTLYKESHLSFEKPMHIGDVLNLTLTLIEKNHHQKPYITIHVLCTNNEKEIIAEGNLVVKAPTKSLSLERGSIPKLDLETHTLYSNLMHQAQKHPPLRTAIIYPTHPKTLEAILDAMNEGLLDPILIGPKHVICKAAKACGLNDAFPTIIDISIHEEAAAKGVSLAASGDVQALMKGDLHTHDLLHAIVDPKAGLRTEHFMSHAYVMEAPHYHKPLILTDAAMNIAPNIEVKADICQNAIDLWHALFGCNGYLNKASNSPSLEKEGDMLHVTHPPHETLESKSSKDTSRASSYLPKVAALAAVETVTSKMQSTIDATALCKMAERGQIVGGIIDGPLAFDNAISKQAAKEKGIVSPVSGDVDILVAPNIEAGNVLAKQLTFLGHSDAAGIVLGACVPIILTSRADNLRTRLLSCALAVLLSAHKRSQHIESQPPSP